MPDKDTPDAYPSSWSPRATRILQIAVIVMGVLIVTGLIVVVGTIVSRMGGDEAAPAAAVRVGGPELERLMGPDAEVVSAVTDSGRLALTLKTRQGVRVILIDMRSGEIISVIGGS